MDNNFAPFLGDDITWSKKSESATRGFVDDGEDVQEARRKTAVQKSVQLELMLGQIANYCSVISRNTVVKNSTSLRDIWQRIRQHYGFQSTGANFLNLVDIKLQPDERPEDLYQRLVAFVEDNLLSTECGITHHGQNVTSDEDLTPTLENIIVVLWLQLIHPGLPQLVKQRYGTELRNQSIASLKPEISQALQSLLDELRTIEDTKALRTFTYRKPTTRQKAVKSCILCKTAGRPSFNTHYLSQCRHLPESDRRQLVRSRLVEDATSECCVLSEDPHTLFGDPCSDEETDTNLLLDQPTVKRVSVVQSPVLSTFYLHHPVRLTLDTGATTNMVSAAFAQAVKLPVSPATQQAKQADGVTPLDVIGEVHCRLTRDEDTFQLDALVVKQLDVDALAGNPFLVTNDIATRPAKGQIVIKGKRIVYYNKQSNGNASVRRAQACVLRGPPMQTAILPGEFLELVTPNTCDSDATWALEPRLDSPINCHSLPEKAWPEAQEISSVGSTIRVVNSTDKPIVLKRHEHVCQIRPVVTVGADHVDIAADSSPTPYTKPTGRPFSADISVDPDNILSAEMRSMFDELHTEFDDVFNPAVSKYNGASGKLEAVVNMGPTLPPQRKGRLPHYNREKLVELQAKFDELEAMGVFATPEQLNVTVEYLNLSFLVHKPNGGSRLVTSFGEVGQYCKPQPSLMPNVDNVLRDIAGWKYLIKTDLLKSFYQIPLSHDSMKYCGVATPFKGIRVYTRCAMGMPGSETYLEELMCRVLGELIQANCVVKLADDLFCGGDTPEEALHNWCEVLRAMRRNNLRLSSSKTVICPKTTTVLGWVWSDGTLSASPHRISALAAVPPPSTVQALRSFIGAFKALSRVMYAYADLLDPLDKAVAGRNSKEKVTWTDDLLEAFRKAQSALSDNKKIAIPRPDDNISIVTDASVKSLGLAATMYVTRGEKTLLAGFYSAKLKKHQLRWLPCELEALAIAAAVKHFSPYVTSSTKQTQVLTDSRPCVQAFDRLRRGEFSASARVTTFLSVVSRYDIILRHISGATNIPSDYCSRHPSECIDQSCQVCKFVIDTADSVVRGLTVIDVIEGGARMPFTSRAAWQATQHECGDLRRTHSHLTQGTRPSKKVTGIPDVKRYLREVSVARDGLLVVREDKPFRATVERIVVPRAVLDGLLTAIHIRFNHPSAYQTKQLFNKYFFALDLDKAVGCVTRTCHHCESLKTVPAQLCPQSSSNPPHSIGRSFAADVMKRYGQLIFVMRETVSSYTLSCFIDSERHDDLRQAILFLLADVRHLGDGGTVIRVDPAPGFVSLTKDPLLTQYGITLDIGSPKNCNKNPVAERAIEELGLECLHMSPEGGPVSKISLAIATATMNSRIRHGGLSAREIFTQRDQITGEQLPIVDQQLIQKQSFNRSYNHASSSSAKAGNRPCVGTVLLGIGNLVFLRGDKSKYQARDKYIVVGISDTHYQLRKFTQSQLRSKTYDVRHSECYPVGPSTLSSGYTGPIRGLRRDDNIQPSIVSPSPRHDPVVEPDPVLDTQEEHPVSEPVTFSDNEAEPESCTSDLPVTTPRKSTRPKTRPTWQTTGEWIME